MKTDPLLFDTGSLYINFPTDGAWYADDGKAKDDCFVAGQPAVFYGLRPINDCKEFTPIRIGTHKNIYS